MWPGEEGEGPEPEPRWELRSEGHAGRFFEAAWELRGQGQLVDVVVTAGARRFPAHGLVLAALSAFFRQRLARGAGGELDGSRLATPRAWEALLGFAYTGAVAAVPGVVGELAAAGQALGAPRVAELGQRAGGPPGRSPQEEQWETLRGIQELYAAGVGCDLTLSSQGETFPAHRLALSCGCEYFRAMLCGGMREARPGAAPLPTLLAPAELRLLLPFAYSGAVAGGWAELLAAADAALRYQASELLALCLGALRRGLSPARSLDLLAFARAYDLRPLAAAARAYALANFAQVARSPGFPALPLPELLALLGADELQVAGELEAFEAALRWLEADRAQRLPHAEAVLACVRFGRMSTRELRRARAAELLAPPGRLYQLMVAAVGCEGPSPCRVHTPPEALVVCGGEGLAPSLATRRPIQELWFAHRFRSGVGLVKEVEWRRLGQFPDGPRFRHAVAVLGNALYVLGGKRDHGLRDALATAFRYDPAQDSWQRLADMPGARSSFPAVGLAGQLYALGGSSKEAYCTAGVHCYDPPTDTWRPCPPLPAPLCGHAACALDGSLYVSGGSDGSDHCRTWLLRLGPGGPRPSWPPWERSGPATPWRPWGGGSTWRGACAGGTGPTPTSWPARSTAPARTLGPGWPHCPGPTWGPAPPCCKGSCWCWVATARRPAGTPTWCMATGRSGGAGWPWAPCPSPGPICRPASCTCPLPCGMAWTPGSHWPPQPLVAPHGTATWPPSEPPVGQRPGPPLSPPWDGDLAPL